MMKILLALSTFFAPLVVVQGITVECLPCEGLACEIDFPQTCDKLLTENDCAGDCCSLSTQSSGCRLTVTNGSCTWNALPVSIVRHDRSDTPFAFLAVANRQATATSDFASECPASEFDASGRPPAKEGTVQGLIMTLRGVESLTSEQLDFEWAPACVAHASNYNLDLDTVSRVQTYFARSHSPGALTVYFLHTMSCRSETDIDLNALIDDLFSTNKVQAFLGLLRQKGMAFEAARGIEFPARQQGDLSGELSLEGIGSLTKDEIDDFQSIIQDHIFNCHVEPRTDATVTSASATVEVTNRAELMRGFSRRRKLQDSAVTIACDILISFRTTNDDLSPLEVASYPFIDDIATLEGSLQNGGGSLCQVASMSANALSVSVSPTAVPLPTDMPMHMPTFMFSNRGIGDSAMSLGAKTSTLASLLLLISIGCRFL